jgi:hypothetical protein
VAAFISILQRRTWPEKSNSLQSELALSGHQLPALSLGLASDGEPEGAYDPKRADGVDALVTPLQKAGIKPNANVGECNLGVSYSSPLNTSNLSASHRRSG